MSERPLYDEGLERGVLAIALWDPASVPKIVGQPPKLFATVGCKTLHGVLAEMQRKGEAIDGPTVSHRLQDVNLPPDFLTDVSGRFVSPRVLDQYLDDLHELFRKRAQRAAAEQALEALKHGDDSAAVGLVLQDGVRILEGSKAATPRRGFSIRKPSEITSQEFNDSDMIVGDRLIAEGQPSTIIGQAGLGKSRLLLQLAYCQITGRSWMGLETHGRPRRWLIVQGENSNRRLQQDLARLDAWVGPSGARAVEDFLLIHTLEEETDGDLSLEFNAQRLRETIEMHKPDVACFDPLSNFSLDDLNTDVVMRNVCVQLSQIAKSGDPRRAIVLLHHAIAGRAGAQKATGFDRSAFGRNSKALLAWTRAQINIAPGSSENNAALVIACGKSNNGQEFPKFAARLEEGVYSVDHQFDFEAWGNEVAGGRKSGAAAGPTPDRVREWLGGDEMCKAQLAAVIMSQSGRKHSAAYDAIDAAVARKTIQFLKVSKTYVAR